MRDSHFDTQVELVESLGLEPLEPLHLELVYNHMVMKDAEPLNATFAALADPTRRAILARLASGEATVTELAEPFDMSQPAISKHLKVLERAGLIVVRPGRAAPARASSSRSRSPMRSSWIENYRKHWEAAFARLDDVLEELKAEKKQRTEKKDRKRKK